MNIGTKLNLAGLKHSIREIKGQNGMVECLVIPIEVNHLHKGEKGIYVDFVGFEIKNKVGDSKDTHLVKQSLPKEVFEAMTEEQKQAQPILGSHRVFEKTQLGEAVLNVQAESDNLPF